MRKLLIVDDDPAVLSFVAKVAESLQYEVVRAKDGLDALLAYSDAPGIDLAKPFSPQQQGSGLLVLFMSGA